jgi:protein phosphatase
MTEDHSVVAGLVRNGILTVEQATYHEDRHVLTRALGTRHDVEISLWEESISVHAGDRFLLCSDGLYDLLSPDDLLKLSSQPSIEEANSALVTTANERGGPDNISSILVEVAAQPSPSDCGPSPECQSEGALSV